MERASEVKYARNGDVHLAYRVLGTGPRELVLMSTWFISIEAVDDGPTMSRAIERLAGLGRIVLFDRRGVGLSDPSSPDSPPTLEQWAEDALAVCDEVGFTSPVVLRMDPSGGLIALFLAATHPHRVSALVLFNAHARVAVADDYPDGLPVTVLAERAERSVESVMHGDGALGTLAPDLAPNDPMREWWITYRRRGASPAMLRRLISLTMQTDVRPLLPAIRTPTLVMHYDASETVPVASADTLQTTSKRRGSSNSRVGAASSSSVTPKPSSGRSRSSSRAHAAVATSTGGSRRCSSPTSSRRRSVLRRLATLDGASSWTPTTEPSGVNCSDSEAWR